MYSCVCGGVHVHLCVCVCILVKDQIRVCSSRAIHLGFLTGSLSLAWNLALRRAGWPRSSRDPPVSSSLVLDSRHAACLASYVGD